MDPSRGDSRYNLNYSMSGIGLSLVDQADLYGNPGGSLGGGNSRPPSSGGLIQTMGRTSSSSLMSLGGTGGGGNGGGGGGSNSGSGGNGGQQCHNLGGQSRGLKRSGSDCYEDHHRSSVSSMTSQSLQGLDGCSGQQNTGTGQSGTGGNIPDVVDDSYTSLQNKKSPPANGKKTKGRVKIKMEYIDNKLRRYTTFSKRKTGIMKKAYELSTLTGTQVMLLVASETGHVYTFATRKLQPMITSEAGKQLIQTCLNSPDPPSNATGGGDQRMSATGFEETELSYNIADEDSKDDRSPLTSGNESDESSENDSPLPSQILSAATAAAAAAAGNQSTSSSSAGGLIGFNSNLSSKSGKNLQIEDMRQRIEQEIERSSSAGCGKIAGDVSSMMDYEIPKTCSLSFDTSTVGTSSISSASPSRLGSRCSTSVGIASSSMPPKLTGIKNILYPQSALSNIPQEILLSLVQSGQLQIHHDEENTDGPQFIAIPLSSVTGGSVSTTSTTTTSGISENLSQKCKSVIVGSGNSTKKSHSSSELMDSSVIVSSENANITSTSTPVPQLSARNSNKVHIKDLNSMKSSSLSSSTFLNGNEPSSSPPPLVRDGIHIKKEILE